MCILTVKRISEDYYIRMFLLFTLLYCLPCCLSWNADELSLYDLVEELQSQNFYEFLGVSQDSTVNEIRRAYRKQSMQVHPDRNKEADAAHKFRQLAAVFEILKDEELRQTYNNVLEFGLPDWRMPVYYFRQVRKMPWWETVVIVVAIVTLCQYLMMWGAYFEKRLALSEAFESLRKKEKKMKRKYKIDDVDDYIDAEIEKQLNRPQLTNLLPVAFPRWLISCISHTPELIGQLRLYLNPPPPIEEEVKVRRVNASTAWLEPLSKEEAQLTAVTNAHIKHEEQEQSNGHIQTPTQNEWTLDELAQLVKLTTLKYPTGTLNRWEKIASVLRRKPEDIVHMVGQLKKMDPKDYSKLCTDNAEESENKINKEEAEWSQLQQKSFEEALQKIPKSVQQRWEKIAACVQGKTKEECMVRYKHLVELVRQRKTVPTNK